MSYIPCQSIIGFYTKLIQTTLEHYRRGCSKLIQITPESSGNLFSHRLQILTENRLPLTDKLLMRKFNNARERGLIATRRGDLVTAERTFAAARVLLQLNKLSTEGRVSPRSWLPLIALDSIVGVAVIWSIYGRIPITVEGQGVLIYPSNVVPLQSKSAGQLMALNIKVGDVIKKGQVLATIDQAELGKQLQQQQAKLTQLELQDQAVGSLQGQRLQQEKRSQSQQSHYLQQRILELRTITPLLKTKGNTSIDHQRQGLQQRLSQAQALNPVFLQRMEIRRQLFKKEGAISGDEALKAEQEYLENLEKIADIQNQLKELDVKTTQTEKDYHENLSTISDLQAQLKELDSKQASVAQQDLESVTTRKKEIQEVKREIAQLEVQLGDNSQIISQYSGRILEITLTPGQVVSAGTRLATIEAENPKSKLVGVTYFPVSEGKKIKPGMTIQITPQTVKRERFGGIVANVTIAIAKVVRTNSILIGGK